MSLFVSNLHPDCNEFELKETFSSIGKVAAVFVCRDSESDNSLEFGYVNFAKVEDAQKAIDTLNGAVILGKAMSIMWLSDPGKFEQSANLVVKNLHPGTNESTLKEVFSPFGNILSIETNNNSKGDLKGCGYIQFAEAEAADLALACLKDAEIGGRHLLISKSKQWQKYITLIRKEYQSEDVTDIYERLNTTLVKKKLVVIVMCPHVAEVVQDWIVLGDKMKTATSTLYVMCLVFHAFKWNRLAIATAGLGLASHSVHHVGWERDPLSHYGVQPQKAKETKSEQLVLVRKTKSSLTLHTALAVSAVGLCAFWIWKSDVIEKIVQGVNSCGTNLFIVKP